MDRRRLRGQCVHAGARYGTFPQSNDCGGRLQFRSVNPSSLYGCLAGIFRGRVVPIAISVETFLTRPPPGGATIHMHHLYAAIQF